MPGKAQTGGVDIVGLAYLAIVFAVVFFPVFLVRSPSPPPADSDHDEGGGPRRPQPPDPHTPPSGGVPLPDAEQSALRLRDHGRLRDRYRRRRHRPAHDPVKTPRPVKTP